MRNKMTYCFDLDGTLCSQTKNGDYSLAEPFFDCIEEVNRIFSEGHTVIIDTARGGTSGINWREITEKQLSDWGVKYHKLRVGEKIHADIFVDDKAVNASAWRLMISRRAII